MKTLRSLLSAIALMLALTSSHCGAPPVEPPKEVGQTTQALSQNALDVEYYSDSTYTTLVGGYASNCGGSASSWGKRTRFAMGTAESCRTGITYSCYQTTCDNLGNCWQGCSSGQCVSC